MTNTQVQHRLVIDTDVYSGSFERQMIAFATGQVGECGVGEEQAELARQQLPEHIREFWEDHAIHEADEHGCHRPASIYPTPGFFNHGLGEAFPDTPEGRAEGLARYKIAVQKWVDKDLADLDRVVVGQNGWTQKHVDESKDRLAKRLEESQALTEVRRHPSYQSVSILCEAKPSEDVVANFIERVNLYAENYQDFLKNKTPINILGIFVQEENIEVKVDRKKVFSPR